MKGEPALVESTSPRYGEKASYYSAVCLETGEVEWMELEGNSNSGTSAAFLDQLRKGHAGPLNVIWDNAPAHRGEAVREYLRTPELELRLVNLPGYSPDFNADEAIWGWAREEATGNLCLGTKALVQQRVGNFLGRTGQPERRGEAPLPDGPTVKGRSAPAKFPGRFPASGECTSHLGLGLGPDPDPVMFRASPARRSGIRRAFSFSGGTNLEQTPGKVNLQVEAFPCRNRSRTRPGDPGQDHPHLFDHTLKGSGKSR